MSVPKRKTVRDVVAMKSGSAAIVCLTAYTAPMARLADAHADLVLVGDSLGMVLYGMDSTMAVTPEMMIAHGRAVVRASARALVVVDMPFGSYQESPEQAFRNAARIMQETGAGAVKLEGGEEMAETVSFLTRRGIPVMGHTGLQPQSVHASGGYRVMGRERAEHMKILQDSRAVAEAGAFGVVLECIDPGLAEEITRQVAVPTIGIGASAACDGQILVSEDMLGLSGTNPPKFVRRYASLDSAADRAMEAYAADVRSRRFPGEEHVYGPAAGAKKAAAAAS